MNRLILPLLVLFLLSSIGLYAQISEGGTPPSFSLTAKGFNNNIPSEWLPTLNLEQIREEDEADGGFYKIGRLIPVDYNTDNSGLWQTLPNGDRLWRLKIEANNEAKALNPYFDDFYMPVGAKLFLYNEYKEQILGAYTHQNNPKNGTEFSTDQIRDNTLIIEYYEPAGTTDAARLSISDIGYAYRGVTSLRETRDFGDSQGCEVNVNCSPAGDDWQDEKNAVARILVRVNQGFGFCSGSLVNNVRQDCTPYFLTALHCGVDGSVLTSASNLNQWVFYFNYEAPDCTNPGSEGTLANQSISGCTAISNSNDGGGNSGSDFLLLELSSQPPASYGVYYLGWDANNTTSGSGACLHHPAGDIMKISTYSSNLTSTQWGSAAGSHWQVVWSANGNGWGVTEGGSSGSMIANSAGQLVGTLTGGSSFCTAQSSPDQYGKMSYHWTSNGTPATEQLKPWLDPDNTGALTLGGTYAPCNGCDLSATTTGTDQSCALGDGTATVSATGGTAPYTYQWDAAAGNQTGQTATGLAPGSYSVVVSDSDICVYTANITIGNSCNAICDTIGNFDIINDTPSLIGSNNGGYISGQNGYGDIGKSDYFDYTGGIHSDVKGVYMGFGTAFAGSATSTFDVVMRDGTSGTPGAALETVPVLYQDIVNLIAGGTNTAYIEFPNPVAIPASQMFFIGIEFAGTGADTIALITNADGEQSPATAWEQWSDNDWYAYDDASSWGLGMAHLVLPVLGTAPSVAITPTTATACDGDQVSFAATGTDVEMYMWEFPGGSPNTSTMQNPVVTYSTPGTYDFSLIAINGCMEDSLGFSSAVIINSCSGCDLTVSTSATDESCTGQDGTATVAATLGTAPYNYQWSIGAGSQTTATATGLSAGAYTVTVTDSGNPQCTQVANVTVAGTPNTVTVMTTSSTPESCAGQDGTATAAGAGGSAPYSYMWDNGQMMATATGLAAGTYTVIITDANGCSATAQVPVGDACAMGCDSISNYDFDLYTAALFGVPAPDAGLLSGTNTLGDQAYADYYVYPGANSTIKGAYFYFEGLDIANPATSTVDVTIWDAVAGAPGSVLGVAPVLMQDIQTFLDDATANMTSPLYWVEFNPYVALPANQEFFIGMQVPTTAGDTIGIVTSTIDFVQNPPVADAPSPGTGYIQDATGAWATYEAVWTFPFTHLIVPVLGTEPTAAFTPNQPTTICTGDMVTFTNQSTDATDYEWVIQGGTPSSATTEDITVTYDTEGIFGVALIATNDCISDTIAVLDMIEVEVCTGCTIAATASVIDISCNGLCDGAIDLVVTGGTPPYTYTWSDGSTGEDPTGLCAGTYTVSVIDATGTCGTAVTATITEPSPIVTSISATAETCAGQDGTATVTATGGIPPYAYQWDANTGNQTSMTAVGLVAGTYTVLVLDANGCATDAIVTVDNDCGCNGLSAAVTATDASCNGLCDGSIDLTVTGGTAPFVYTWSDGSTVEDPTGLCPGTYTVTVVDATGNCQTTASATIGEPTAIVATTSATPETCAGNDGTATATASGGTGALAYEWDVATGSQTTMTATGLTAGLYIVTITDDNGCTTITEVEVADACGNCVLTASTTGEDILCQLITLCSGSATAIPSNGIAPYTYQWDANAFSQTTETATGLCAGTYAVTVTDIAGCSATAEQTILDIPGLTDVTVDSAPESCPGVCDGQAAAVVIGGTMPYTYLWDNGNTTAFQDNLCAGTYTITVTDANGCALAQSVVVDGAAPIMQGSTIVNPTSCLGGDGSFDATFFGGTPPYQCSIDGGVTFVSGGSFGGLDAGVYILNCIDANGCVADPITIEVADGCICTVAGTITTTDATCGAASGTATATGTGGAAPYTYSWDTGGTTQTITGLAPGTYTVSVLDALGCDDIATATINDSGVLAVALDATDLTCNGDNNGSASVTTAGSFNYLWNTGSTASSINGLTGGNYTVTVTQGTCTDIQSIVVNEPAALNVNVQTQDSPCSANNGSATAIASGGTPPFTYNWNTGDTAPAISGLSSGSYTVTVIDANNCSTVSGGTLTSQNSGPVVTLNTGSQTSISCNGNSDGIVDINVGNGTQPLNYSWSNGATTEDLSNVPADTYTVIVTDANGCIGVLTVVVSEPSPMSLTYNTMPSSGNDGTASVNVSGGTPPYSYQWSDGQTGQTATGLAPGTYTVAITDANGCTINGSVSVEEYTGTYDLENLTNFELYPNPSTGEFTIALDFTVFEKADIFVYNTLGQGIAALYREGTNLRVPMNISGQAAGTYFVIIQTDKGKAVKKFSLIR